MRKKAIAILLVFVMIATGITLTPFSPLRTQEPLSSEEQQTQEKTSVARTAPLLVGKDLGTEIPPNFGSGDTRSTNEYYSGKTFVVNPDGTVTTRRLYDEYLGTQVTTDKIICNALVYNATINKTITNGYAQILLKGNNDNNNTYISINRDIMPATTFNYDRKEFDTYYFTSTNITYRVISRSTMFDEAFIFNFTDKTNVSINTEYKIDGNVTITSENGTLFFERNGIKIMKITMQYNGDGNETHTTSITTSAVYLNTTLTNITSGVLDPVYKIYLTSEIKWGELGNATVGFDEANSTARIYDKPENPESLILSDVVTVGSPIREEAEYYPFLTENYLSLTEIPPLYTYTKSYMTQTLSFILSTMDEVSVVKSGGTLNVTAGVMEADISIDTLLCDNEHYYFREMRHTYVKVEGTVIIQGRASGHIGLQPFFDVNETTFMFDAYPDDIYVHYGEEIAFELDATGHALVTRLYFRDINGQDTGVVASSATANLQSLNLVSAHGYYPNYPNVIFKPFTIYTNQSYEPAIIYSDKINMSNIAYLDMAYIDVLYPQIGGTMYAAQVSPVTVNEFKCYVEFLDDNYEVIDTYELDKTYEYFVTNVRIGGAQTPIERHFIDFGDYFYPLIKDSYSAARIPADYHGYKYFRLKMTINITGFYSPTVYAFGAIYRTFEMVSDVTLGELNNVVGDYPLEYAEKNGIYTIKFNLSEVPLPTGTNVKIKLYYSHDVYSDGVNPSDLNWIPIIDGVYEIENGQYVYVGRILDNQYLDATIGENKVLYIDGELNRKALIDEYGDSYTRTGVNIVLRIDVIDAANNQEYYTVIFDNNVVMKGNDLPRLNFLNYVTWINQRDVNDYKTHRVYDIKRFGIPLSYITRDPNSATGHATKIKYYIRKYYGYSSGQDPYTAQYIEEGPKTASVSADGTAYIEELDNGYYEIKWRMIDDRGDEYPATPTFYYTARVHMLNVDPKIDIRYNEKTIDQTFVADVSIDDLDGEIVKTTVDWGDGEISEYRGMIYRLEHVYLKTGKYRVKVSVIDNDGDKSEVIFDIYVEENRFKASVEGKSVSVSIDGAVYEAKYRDYNGWILKDNVIMLEVNDDYLSKLVERRTKNATENYSVELEMKISGFNGRIDKKAWKSDVIIACEDTNGEIVVINDKIRILGNDRLSVNISGLPDRIYILVFPDMFDKIRLAFGFSGFIAKTREYDFATKEYGIEDRREVYEIYDLRW